MSTIRYRCSKTLFLPLLPAVQRNGRQYLPRQFHQTPSPKLQHHSGNLFLSHEIGSSFAKMFNGVVWIDRLALFVIDTITLRRMSTQTSPIESRRQRGSSGPMRIDNLTELKTRCYCEAVLPCNVCQLWTWLRCVHARAGTGP